MTNSDLVGDILSKVLNAVVETDYSIPTQHLERSFLVVPGNNGPRWILPSNAALAEGVLAQWTPYGALSRLKWQVLRLLYRYNLLHKIPTIIRVSNINNLSVFSEGDVKKHTCVPVIYVGTLGPQQKSVVTLVDVQTARALAVFKVPIGGEAQASIKREACMLRLLAELNVRHVPQLISLDELSGTSLQTVVPGMLAERPLKCSHVDWLLELPTTGKTVSFVEQKIRLRLLIDCTKGLSNDVIALCLKTLDAVQDKGQFPLVILHGDFTPWNMKMNKTGILTVIDWEDGSFDGIPLWDLCHFNFMQGHLFNEKYLVKGFCSNSYVTSYLARLGIPWNYSKSLTLIYMISKIVDVNTNADYRNFLVENISVVLNK